MQPKRDLENREDLEVVLRAFYAQAIEDALIGHFFTGVVPLDLEAHLPHIIAFWESVVFQQTGYGTNVMELHAQIHRLSPIRKEHLQRWVHLFTLTVSAHFEGDRAELMRQRALSVATLMQIKLDRPNGINKL